MKRNAYKNVYEDIVQISTGKSYFANDQTRTNVVEFENDNANIRSTESLNTSTFNT